MKAIYKSNFVQTKEGAGKGKVFHVYAIHGTQEELAEYVNSPQFKAYPRTDKVTGAPQLVTMYMDPLRDELPLYKKDNGDFTLDGSETRKDVSRIEALAKISPALEKSFAVELVERITRPQSAKDRILAAAKAAAASTEKPVEDLDTI